MVEIFEEKKKNVFLGFVSFFFFFLIKPSSVVYSNFDMDLYVYELRDNYWDAY